MEKYFIVMDSENLVDRGIKRTENTVYSRI